MSREMTLFFEDGPALAPDRAAAGMLWPTDQLERLRASVKRHGPISFDQLVDLRFFVDEPVLTDKLVSRRLRWLAREYQIIKSRRPVLAAGGRAGLKGIIVGLARGDRRRVRWELRWLWLQHRLFNYVRQRCLAPQKTGRLRAFVNDWAVDLLRSQPAPPPWRPKINLTGVGEEWMAWSDGAQAGLVTIVMPVYNQATWLKEALTGVIGQSYQNWELIVVDDGSIDDPAAVVAPFLKDPRVRFISRPHAGLPATLTFGFRQARGEYLTWNSADNILAPTNFAAFVDFLQRHGDAHFAYSDFEAIDERSEPYRAHFNEPGKQMIAPNYYEIKRDTSDLNVTNNFLGASFMYRSLPARLIGGYDGSLGVEDYDYFMRFNSLFRLRHIGTRRSLLQYRYHGASLSGTAWNRRSRVIDQRLRILLRWERQYRQPHLRRPFHLASSTIKRGAVNLLVWPATHFVTRRREWGRHQHRSDVATVLTVTNGAPDELKAWSAAADWLVTTDRDLVNRAGRVIPNLLWRPVLDDWQTPLCRALAYATTLNKLAKNE